MCFENAARALPHCAGIWLQRYWTWRGVRVYDRARWPTRPCSIRSEFSRSSFEPMFPFPLRNAEKKVTPRLDEGGSDTSEAEPKYIAKLAASIPFSAILMISWNLCFHES